MLERKPFEDRIAALRAKQEKTAARINALQAKAKTEERKQDTRRKIVVGGTILHAIGKDPQFALLIAQLLDRTVGRQVDRAVVADLLPSASPAPRPSPSASFSPAAQGVAS